MNNKLMSYEEAVKQVKHYAEKQNEYKEFRNSQHKELREWCQKAVAKNKVHINYLLNIIHLHKQSRKLWAEANKKHEYGYMCKVDFDHELGCALGGNTVYPSLKDLRDNHSECHFGSVKVKISLEEVIKDEDVTGDSCE